MTAAFVKTVSNYRRVQTRVRESIQALAMRELGDASRWVEIVNMNGLVPPYLTDDHALAGAQVLLAGSQIMLPTGAASTSMVIDPASVFGVNIALNKGRIDADESGDMRVVSGTKNLTAALEHRLATHPGDLLFHPTYGCPAYQLVGRKTGEATALLGSAWIKQTIQSDPRISSVSQSTATISGDSLQVDAIAITVDGRQLPITVT